MTALKICKCRIPQSAFRNPKLVPNGINLSDLQTHWKWDPLRAEQMGIERDRLRGAQGERPSQREGTSQHDPRFQKILAEPEPKTTYK